MPVIDSLHPGRARDGTVVATGANEVPAAGGGYGEVGGSRNRLHDESNREQNRIIDELICSGISCCCGPEKARRRSAAYVSRGPYRVLKSCACGNGRSFVGWVRRSFDSWNPPLISQVRFSGSGATAKSDRHFIRKIAWM